MIQRLFTTVVRVGCVEVLFTIIECAGYVKVHQLNLNPVLF